MAAATALEELQRTWEGVLYTLPGHKINGRAVGPFGWVGITASPGEHGELLRATYKQTKLKSLKRPARGSEEEAAALLTLASLLVEAHQARLGADADAGTPPHGLVACSPHRHFVPPLVPRLVPPVPPCK